MGDEYTLPEVLENPPEEYPRIVNRIGLYGNMPTLHYDGHPHRIPVTLPFEVVENGETSIDEFVKNHGPSRLRPDRKDVRQEFREAVEQAIEFHEEYQDELDELVEYRKSDEYSPWS